ncbi:MAG: hypothetical protein JWN04_1709 [Myxococcaceae bacterium]|nr:hypothetical protein [Myxococcaceae bacterium]
MLAIINHWHQYPVDLSLPVAGVFVSGRMLPAGENSATFTTRPQHIFTTQAHIDAINALPSTDVRKQAISSFEAVDMGTATAAGPFEITAQQTLAAALQPRPINIINNVRVRS